MNGAAGGKQSFCTVITLGLGEILMSVLGRKPHVFIFCFSFFSLCIYFLLFSSTGESEIF